MNHNSQANELPICIVAEEIVKVSHITLMFINQESYVLVDCCHCRDLLFDLYVLPSIFLWLA